MWMEMIMGMYCWSHICAFMYGFVFMYLCHFGWALIVVLQFCPCFQDEFLLRETNKMILSYLSFAADKTHLTESSKHTHVISTLTHFQSVLVGLWMFWIHIVSSFNQLYTLSPSNPNQNILAVPHPSNSKLPTLKSYTVNVILCKLEDI